MKYVKIGKVKERIHGRGKRATKGFLLWLDRRIETLLDRHMHMLGSRSTLDAQEAELLWK